MNKKPIRDALVTGSPAAISLAVLVELGVDTGTAAAASMVISSLASGLYRIVRERWAWLLAADKPSGMK